MKSPNYDYSEFYHSELWDSLGEVPVNLPGKIDRIELQHPILTLALAEGAGLVVAAGVTLEQHGTLEVPATNSQVQPGQPEMTTINPDMLSGGIILGTIVYASLRAALRTRFGLKSNSIYARRDFLEGPVPRVDRFTSLSTESISSRKKAARKQDELYRKYNILP